MHRFLNTIALTGITLLVFCGCASPKREADLARILKDLERASSTNVTAYPSHDMPESPMAPPPASVPEAALSLGDTGEVRIRPDCLLEVNVEEDPSLDGTYPVNDVGAINLRYVGPVILYNKTEKQAEEKIRDVLRQRDFRKATVKVRVLRSSYDRVQVSGEINRPGIVTIGAGETITLNEALLRAGGLKPSTRPMKIHIIRGGLLSAVPFALEPEEYPLTGEDGRPEIPAVQLRPNDIAHILPVTEKAGRPETAEGGSGRKEIIVLGEVARPGVYRFEPDEPCTMMHLMFKMGGLPPYANQKAVKVVRRQADGTEQEIKVNVDRLMKDGNPEDDVVLENGDRVKVPARRISLF